MSGGFPDRPLPPMKAHRCNDRIEDLMQSVFTGEFSGKVKPAWNLLWACLRSEPGEEPVGNYAVITDPQRYLKPHYKKRRPKPPPEDNA